MSNRQIDGNGFLLVKGCPLSSYGIFDYSAGQLGLPGDPMRIVKVFRPESAVSDPEAMASFMNVPLINDHEMLSGFKNDEGATAPEDYGVSGILTSNIYYDAPWMRGDLKVFSRELQAALDSGKKDLSLGYSCDFEVKPGVWQGQAYEVVQTNMRGNHIALVKEGRVPGARVLDGLCFDHLSFLRPSDKEDNMALTKKAVKDNALAQLKALLPALSQILNEGAEAPAQQEGGPDAAAAGAESGTGAAAEPVAANGAVAATNEGDGDPNAQAGAAPATADPAAGGDDLASVLAAVKAAVAQIEAMTSGGAAAGADEGEMNAEEAADNVEGLATNGQAQGAAVGSTGENNGEPGKASPGPAAGGNATANDASLRNFYADFAAKNSLYNRLSKVVGAFDHASMDSRAVAAYGVKKLNSMGAKIKAKVGDEAVVLDAYLNGVERTQVSQSQTVRKVGDSAQAELTGGMAAYLKG